jgi:hypothetical protein
MTQANSLAPGLVRVGQWGGDVRCGTCECSRRPHRPPDAVRVRYGHIAIEAAS